MASGNLANLSCGVTAVELRPGLIRYESALWETTALALHADGDAVLVDPCISAPELAAIAGDVEARGLEVRAVLVTHADWDHVCGSTPSRASRRS